MRSRIECKGDTGNFQAIRFFVASTIYGIYSDKIIIFMLWLFDIRREFLFQEYITEFEAMNHEDLLDFRHCEEDESVTKRKKEESVTGYP